MPGPRVVVRPFAASGIAAERDESNIGRTSCAIGVICQAGPLVLRLAGLNLSRVLPASSSAGQSLVPI